MEGARWLISKRPILPRTQTQPQFARSHLFLFLAISVEVSLLIKGGCCCHVCTDIQARDKNKMCEVPKVRGRCRSLRRYGLGQIQKGNHRMFIIFFFSLQKWGEPRKPLALDTMEQSVQLNVNRVLRPGWHKSQTPLLTYFNGIVRKSTEKCGKQ